ncbi:MAG: hypothetical protein U5N58_05995 [Actinomycetota bacterium]|nr:hypothetical protein [Actinomycetota bacterium]
MAGLRDFAGEGALGSLLEKIWTDTGYMKNLKVEKTIDSVILRTDNLKESPYSYQGV